MLRQIAERLSRGVAFRRRLPRSVGGASFYVSPDSALSYLKPGAKAFDENLLRLASENIRVDSRVWDIGANVGVFTFAAAGLARAGHVLAVEADVWLSQLIRRSTRLHENRSMRIDVLTAAIAQQNGVSSFNIAKRGRSSNYLDEAGGRTQTGGVRTRVCVPTLTLDTLLQTFPPPTLVKIDVEGAEALVMRGARRLLDEFRPIFYIEVGSDASEEISEIFAGHRYDLYDGEKLRTGQAPLMRCAFNTLAIPQQPNEPGSPATFPSHTQASIPGL